MKSADMVNWSVISCNLNDATCLDKTILFYSKLLQNTKENSGIYFFTAKLN